MNLPNAVRTRYENLRSIDYTGITAVYAVIGVALANPARMIVLTNDTDVGVYISLNGVDDKWYIPSKTSRLLDIGANKAAQGGFLAQPAGDIFYVKALPPIAPAGQVLPTLGRVYLEATYVSQV
jgi:hypothetical protein